MYKTARYELLITVFQIVISPFGSVRFRDFFFANILTSVSTAIIDTGSFYVYFSEDHWNERNPIDKKDYYGLKTYTIMMAFLPYWWRLG